MTRHNRGLAVATELQRANDALQAAETLLHAGLYNDSVSRAYYGVYHIAYAVLLTRGLEPKSHAGLRTLFSFHFVKTGKIEQKYLRLIANMQTHREEADYTSKVIFEKKQAERLLEDAKAFRHAMTHFLRTSGF